MHIAGYEGRNGGQLAGFNPLKAIGRALGSTGRALVSSLPVVGGAVSSVLDTAAHQKADTTAATQAIQQGIALQAGAQTGQQINAANLPSVVSPVVSAGGQIPAAYQPPVAPAQGGSTTDALTAAVLASILKQPTAVPQAGQPAPNISFSTPGYAPQAVPAQASPSWLLPVLLAGGGLFAFSMLNKGK